jgi:hypothetical protein
MQWLKRTELRTVTTKDYDRKAKVRHIKVDDLVYLYNLSVKPGLTKNFLGHGQFHIE